MSDSAVEEPGRRAPRLQFRLSTLLEVITVICVLLGSIGSLFVSWLLLVGAILGGLMLVQLPILYVLHRVFGPKSLQVEQQSVGGSALSR